jgi:hypothetical protein
MHVPKHKAAALMCFTLPLLAALGSAALPAAAQIAPALTALRPIKGISYQPSPSDDCQLQTQNNATPPCSTPLNGYNPTYYESVEGGPLHVAEAPHSSFDNLRTSGAKNEKTLNASFPPVA